MRFVVRDFPLTDIHGSALLASVAARCAGQQQQFWPMYEQLFVTHSVEWGGVPKRDREVMVELADGLGLDSEAFTACLDDPATEQSVLAERDVAIGLGINSTPNFLVNGQLIRGALPFTTFQRLIEQEATR